MSNANTAVRQRKRSGFLGCLVRRFLLCLFTALILVLLASALMMNQVFNGPSPAARELLTSSLMETSATSWIPGLFLGEKPVDGIGS